MARKIRSNKSGSRKSSTIRKRSRKVISRKTMRRKAISRMTNQKRSNRVKRAKRVSRYKRKNIQKGGRVGMKDYVGKVIKRKKMSDIVVLKINESDKTVSFSTTGPVSWEETFEEINEDLHHDNLYAINDDDGKVYFDMML
jgi:hypothetical protein